MARPTTSRPTLADECDGRATLNWVVVAFSINQADYGTGRGGYYRTVADGQPLHVTDGLLVQAERISADIWSDE
ncbi:hypothetical protein ATK74_0823 [Propionicimonas paludicola]|uniref:Uncharacterized protein n=1 Tax=Propionicimonas paludicola TaxID=185243 RepID=A0A2A9CRW4_9ACTN|nr:hypothetical protein [Propionicimonas paludicola]PFG16289.1 hypothetical protein ATK74_0823 [Propionicimonas paludicola]